MLTDNNASPGGRDTGGMVVAVVFILLAALSLWDTTTMADADSYVFPRAIAIAMIVLSIMLIVWNLVRPSADNGTVASAWSRRCWSARH